MAAEDHHRLILASASPRRAGLLTRMGLKFNSLPVDIDETPRAGEPPADYVLRLAREKAAEGYRRICASDPAAADALVLGSDTTVVLAGRSLGKPADKAEAARVLAQLSGQTHEVMTAVALADREGIRARLSVTRVTFRDLSAAEIHAYCETGEPLDKAGSYGIQGRGGIFVIRIQGSYSTVVGLPMDLTAEMLAEAGLTVWQQWSVAGDGGQD